MKRILACFLACTMISGFSFIVTAEDTAWKEFYVSENGNDTNPGTKEAPFKTVQAAKDAVRNVNKDMQGDIVVNIEEGYYYLDSMLDFQNEDSGFNGNRVIYRGIGDKKPVISGGKRVTGFKPSQYEDIYEAEFEVPDDVILQLSVNGVRRFAAKGANQVKGVKKPEKYDNEDWYDAHPVDERDNHYNYYNPDTIYAYDGLYISKRDFGFYENPEDILFVWNHEWTTMACPVEEIKQDPDRADNLLVIMQPGLWNYMRLGLRSQAVWPRPEREFTIMNAFELLDEPGEFYYNRKTKKLYYMPAENENMDTAVIIAAVLDTAISLEGNDVTDKLTNITFENLQISDTKWNYIEGILGNQATSVTGIGVSDIASRAVLAQRCDGLEFKNNIFCNIGGSALDLYNAVSNSKVIGNVLYDVGESGITSGARNHSEYNLGADAVSNDVPEEYKDAPVDLISENVTKTYASYFVQDRTTENGAWAALTYPGYGGPDNHDSKEYDILHTTWAKYDYKYAWRDSYSKTIGKKPYVLYEFLRPYSIKQISVSFDPEYIKDGENSDYEILVSNDISFEDGTYKVVATQEGIAPEIINTYTLDDGQKYKYVMIRKTYPGDFAMSRVWVESSDKKPYIKNERCKNIVIENNLAERIGIDAPRSIGLIVTHGENYRIKHNELKDIGYTGMSIGYSWLKTRTSCRNMDVGYNYIYDTNQTGQDGGAIYVLGPHIDSRYYNNYTGRINVAYKGFYTDNGSSHEIIEKTYGEGVLYNLSPYVAGDTNLNISGVTYRNNYGVHPYADDAGAKYNNWEEPKVSVIGQPSRDIYDTVTNAGLEDEYKHLRELIPRGHDNLQYKYTEYKAAFSNEGAGKVSTRKNTLKYELTNTLENGKFGNGLGMYPPEYKNIISDMIKFIDSDENTNSYMKLTKAMEFNINLKYAVNRYSFEDTLKLCEETLQTAKNNIAENNKTENSYPKTAVEIFENSLTELKKKEINNAEEEYDVLIALEDAYNRLEASKNSTAIVKVCIPEAEKVEINNERGEITVYILGDKSMTVSDIDITTEGNSTVARTFESKTDISKTLKIPIYSRGNGKYRIWKLKGEYLKGSETTNTGFNEWAIDTDETELIKRSTDGVTLPGGSDYAYMLKKNNGDEETIITFKPLTNNDKNEFSMIFGANFAENFEYDNINSRFNRCEVKFEDGMAHFYKVNGKTTTLINSVKSNIKWNNKNTLTYDIQEIDKNTYFNIKLNGESLFSEVIIKCSYGRFFGLHNPNMNIKVYD